MLDSKTDNTNNDDDFRYMKFIYLHFGEEKNLRDPCSSLFTTWMVYLDPTY